MNPEPIRTLYPSTPGPHADSEAGGRTAVIAISSIAIFTVATTFAAIFRGDRTLGVWSDAYFAAWQAAVLLGLIVGGVRGLHWMVTGVRLRHLEWTAKRRTLRPPVLALPEPRPVDPVPAESRPSPAPVQASAPDPSVELPEFGRDSTLGPQLERWLDSHGWTLIAESGIGRIWAGRMASVMIPSPGESGWIVRTVLDAISQDSGLTVPDLLDELAQQGEPIEAPAW